MPTLFRFQCVHTDEVDGQYGNNRGVLRLRPLASFSTLANNVRDLILSCAQGGMLLPSSLPLPTAAQHGPPPIAPFIQLRAQGYSNKLGACNVIKNVWNVQLLV